MNFAPGACERLDPYLSSKIVGQELALRQISDAVCDHLAQVEPQRPLVLSLHGPPGVGKSMFHLLAARALYNRKVHPELRCPGLDCAGYKVRMQRAGVAWRRRQQRKCNSACRLPCPSIYSHALQQVPPPALCCVPAGAVWHGLHS
jgi:DNA polymerase III delta prime subunit